MVTVLKRNLFVNFFLCHFYYRRSIKMSKKQKIVFPEKEKDEWDSGESDEGEEKQTEREDPIGEEELSDLRQKMSTLPLTKLAELRKKLGPELFEKALYGKADKKQTSAGAKRPREESSNRPAPKFRKIKGVETGKRASARFDPRFSATCGEFDEVSFHKDYAFLDDLRQKDIQELKKALKVARREQNEAQAERIHQNLLRLQNQQKSAHNQQLMEQVRADLRQTNIERMNRGERPIYLNNNELRQRFLERKQESNGVVREKTNKSGKGERKQNERTSSIGEGEEGSSKTLF